MKDKITKREWAALTWGERIATLKDIYEFKSDRELAEFAFGKDFKFRTLSAWRLGKRTPRKENAQLLEQLAISDPSDIPTGDAFREVFTSSTMDACSDVVINYLRAVKSIVGESCVTRCVAAKLSQLVLKAAGYLVVARHTSVFGSYPAKETVTFTSTKLNDIIAEVDVTLGDDKTIILQAQVGTKTGGVHKIALLANDYGIAEVARKIIRLIFSL